MSVDLQAVLTEHHQNVGWTEGPNNQNPWGPEQGISNAAYCDSGASMVPYHNGYRWWPESQCGEKGSAYCPFHINVGANHGEVVYDHASQGNPADVKAGDLLFYDWNNDGVADHVETAIEDCPSGGRTHNIGYNTGSPEGCHDLWRDRVYLLCRLRPSQYAGAAPPPPAPPAPSAGPLTMYDSVTAADIPADAQAVEGYVDGRYAWSQADWDRFPNAIKVRIAVFASTNDGHMLDCETGDATPDQTPGWVAMRKAAGIARPVIYSNLSTYPAVQQAMANAGQTCDYLIAHPNGQVHFFPGTVGTQYAWPAGSAAGIGQPSGGHFDLNCIQDTGWMPGQVPTPAPAPTPGPAPTPPPAPGPAWPGRVIVLMHPFMSGADVRAWQARMKERGWNIGVDGAYGPQGYGMCRQFQQEKGIGVDGQIGPQTWATTFRTDNVT